MVAVITGISPDELINLYQLSQNHMPKVQSAPVLCCRLFMLKIHPVNT
jgi:hypothetical protein